MILFIRVRFIEDACNYLIEKKSNCNWMLSFVNDVELNGELFWYV